MGLLAADDGSGPGWPAGQVDVELGDLGAPTGFAVGVDRRTPKSFGTSAIAASRASLTLPPTENSQMRATNRR